jgi:hypothetical protein
MEDWLDVRGKEHEHGHISSSHPKTPGAHDELAYLYTPAIWQSAYAAKGAFGAIATAFGLFLFEDWQLDEATAAA